MDPTKVIVVTKEGLAGKKIVATGLLLVAENASYTCFLQYDQLGELLEEIGAKMQPSANTATDLILVGDIEREKDDYSVSAKAVGIEEQFAAKKRKTRLRSITFENLLAILRDEIRGRASVASYGEPPAKGARGRSTYIAPGADRTRASLLPRTLVSTGAGGGTYKGAFYQYFIDEYAEDAAEEEEDDDEL